MQEFVGLAYFAEIPAVIFDVQRAGPSTGMPTRTQQTDILSCAYASHGDTKHVLLFPEDPYECFEFGALSFDLADRLQTPIFMLLDLEIGMNERLCKPFDWDDSRKMDRGKVMTAEELEAGKDFGRYLDVDGDGIPVPHLSRHASDARRLLHPRHLEGPSRALQRGRSRLRREHAAPAEEVRYGEAAGAATDRARRPRRPRGWARSISARPVRRWTRPKTILAERGIHLDLLRVRGFPFHNDVKSFIAEHDQVFVVEQNRDAQLRTLLVNELEIDPAKLTRVLHFDGTPITARFISDAIADKVDELKVVPFRKASHEHGSSPVVTGSEGRAYART